MIEILKTRFSSNMKRHPDLDWGDVEKILKKDKKMLKTLELMEESGGEVDVVTIEEGRHIYCDCCRETPLYRRSLCYDEEALAKRVKNPPKGSALKQAQEYGVRLLDEKLYRRLQEIDEFDLKTSSWIETPDDIREKGGALFCEKRYGRVFVFHNSADSYYSVRGWRGYIQI